MHSILEEFAYGGVTPMNERIKPGSKQAEAMAVLSSGEEKLLRMLDGKEKEVFQRYVEAQSEANGLTAVKNLVYGYKLGLLMTAEAFITSNDIIAGEGEVL